MTHSQTLPHPAPASPAMQRLPEWLGTLLVTLTAVIMIYRFNYNQVGIVLFYALWLPLYVLRPKLILRRGEGTFIAFMVPLYCLYSSLWSAHPSLTFYLSIQFTTTVMCILAIARTVSITSIAKGFALGVTIIMLYIIAGGGYQKVGLTGEVALTGPLGSKNQVGVNCSIALLCATLLLTVPGTMRSRLIFSALPFVVCAVALVLSKSMTSFFTLAAAGMCIALFYILSRFQQKLRLPLLIIGLLAITVMGAFAAAINFSISDAALTSAGKDTTLTGRTELWDEGLRIAGQNPILGHGYSAFWVQGNPTAELLWRYFEIPTRMGFHFHSMYVQSLVDLGLAGTTLLALLVICTLGIAVKRALRHGAALYYSLPLGLAVMFTIRSFFELDFLGNYHMGTLVMYMLVPLMLCYDRQQQEHA